MNRILSVAVTLFLLMGLVFAQRILDPKGQPENYDRVNADQPKSSAPVDDRKPRNGKKRGAITFAREKHLKNIRQLTFQGSNAEAYFSPDEKTIVFQSTRGQYKCDQIYTMNLDGSNKKLVSTGQGRCTCGYILPNGNIIYSSTHLSDPNCPPRPDRSRGYVWPIYPTYEIFEATPKGKVIRRLTKNSGYDAEATLSPDGKKIVFTSKRNGDIDIYTMNVDGTDLRRVTTDLGYDGGPFFSPDGKKIIYRAYHPKTDREVEEYKFLLKKNLIKPTRVDLYVIDVDGKNKKRLTNDGKAHFAPYFHPDGKRIIFCSNLAGGHKYELYLINLDGTGLKRITYSSGFTSFPMFSRDGKKLLFASNRGGKHRRAFNIFICDWVD